MSQTNQKQANISKKFLPGEVVILLGETKFDREMYVFQDPVSFVSEIKNNDRQNGLSNIEFMQNVSEAMSNLHISIPHHTEEAFIGGLIRAGICIPAVLN